MRTRPLILAFVALFVSTLMAIPAQCQDNSSSSQANDNSSSSQGNNDNSPIEGTVVSSTRSTLVVQSDDNQFHLFTYQSGVRPSSLTQGARVRVTAAAPDENGTRAATNVTVLSAASGGGAAGTGTGGGTATRDKSAQAAPVPPKVRDIENDIRRESRRWRLGVRAGAAFDPELFTFGVQSQIGPIFHPRVVFRPNAEFAFGEVTDLVALNLEGVYRFSNAQRRGNWTPYVGAGPALIFIHQNFQVGRQIDFGNFDYETGFNVLAGVQSRRGTFMELKTSLYSGPAPKLRVIVGYQF
jgi:hypothetical protein